MTYAKPSVDMVHRGPSDRPVEKLIEYRRAHYAADSEAASYYTNTPARVQFRFANPIICQLKSGYKVMRIDGGDPFGWSPGEALYVPQGMEIDIDLSAASPDKPIECDCIEIEASRVEGVLARLNENLSKEGANSAALNWSRYIVLRGPGGRDLGLPGLMALFRGKRDVFSEMRIDTRIDDTLLRLLQICRRDLLDFDLGAQDEGGMQAVARLIRDGLDRHFSTADLARAGCVSESTLHRHFRRHFGTTPARFANQLRIAEAKRALRQSGETMKSLAFRLGFADVSHFSRVFRKSAGETPVAYRRRRQQPANMVGWQSGSIS
ncbi:MAG: helix-turn-helix domain-containing protein [Qingshengfaniella sp.]